PVRGRRPERLVPPKATAAAALWESCRRFPLRAFPARQRTVTPGRASRRRPGVRRLLARALTLSGLAGRDAFAEERDVVVVDDERPGQHGLKGAGEAPLGTPCQVVVEVAALGPLRESGDVIRVVLVPHDPDSLAAFVLEALTQDLQQQAGDIVPAAGLGKQLVGDQGAHRAFLSYSPLSP